MVAYRKDVAENCRLFKDSGVKWNDLLLLCADRFNSPAYADLSTGLRLTHLHMQSNAAVCLHLRLGLPLSDGSTFLSWSECKKFAWVGNNAQLLRGRKIPEGLLNTETALPKVQEPQNDTRD